MYIALAVGAVLFVLWIAIHLKSSRPDGDIIPGLHPYRRMMPVIMPMRNESLVYFDMYVEAERLQEYLKVMKERGDVHCDMSHVLVAAAAKGLQENPTMNRFSAGPRLYQRRGVWLSFSMKRRKLDEKAKIATVKLRGDAVSGETFTGLCERINAEVQVERSEDETYLDKELKAFFTFPAYVISAAFKALMWANRRNLLPGGFIKSDAMFTSVFIANLGSLGMDAGFHHLYEWGTCPIFMMVGKVEKRPWVVGEELVVRDILHIRWTYDERVDDGLTARRGLDTIKAVLEDPFDHLGCHKTDGSEDRALLSD